MISKCIFKELIKIRRKGTLQYIREYERIGIWDNEKKEWIRYGLHNTETFEIYHNGKWIEDTIICEDNTWKLIKTKISQSEMLNKLVIYNVI